MALGERGLPWWEPPDNAALADRAVAAARTLLRHRDPATICPSDVARVVGGQQWRSSLTAVRTALTDRARTQELVVRQKGEDVADLDRIKGPIRLAAGPRLQR